MTREIFNASNDREALIGLHLLSCRQFDEKATVENTNKALEEADMKPLTEEEIKQYKLA